MPVKLRKVSASQLKLLLVVPLQGMKFLEGDFTVPRPVVARILHEYFLVNDFNPPNAPLSGGTFNSFPLTRGIEGVALCVGVHFRKDWPVFLPGLYC